MKCGVVRDLLPSYIDKLTCQDSNEIVEKHLQDCEACREYYKEMSEQEFIPLTEESANQAIEPIQEKHTSLGRDSVIEEPTAQEELAITKAMKRFRRRVIGSICAAAAVVVFVIFMAYFELPMSYEKTKLDVWLSDGWMKLEATTVNGVETRWNNGLLAMLPAGSVEFYGSHDVIKEVTIDGEKQCVAFLGVYDTLFYKIRFQDIVEEGNEWGMGHEAHSDANGIYTLDGYDVADITKVYYLDRGIKWIEKADNERTLELIEKYGHLVWTKEEGNQSTYYLKVLE